MSAAELASTPQASFFTRSRSIELGRTAPNWVSVTNSIARALEGSHSVEVLDESNDLLLLKLYRKHSGYPGEWKPSPTVTFVLANGGRSLDFTLTWPEYGAAGWFFLLMVIIAIMAQNLFPYILVLPLLLGAAMFFDHRRITERIDDAVRDCLH